MTPPPSPNIRRVARCDHCGYITDVTLTPYNAGGSWELCDVCAHCGVNSGLIDPHDHTAIAMAQMANLILDATGGRVKLAKVIQRQAALDAQVDE